MNPTDATRFHPHANQPKECADKWINASEAALLLGVSSRSIQRRCRAGTLPARRVQGERGEVWEVEAAALEATQSERDIDSDTTTQISATARHMSATTTATGATSGRCVALISPFSRPKSATNERDNDGDSATLQPDSDDDTRQSVALEAERLRAQLEASHAETARERELNAFLKAQIEEGNRNAAELRKALNEALKIAPRMLEEGRSSEGSKKAEERPQDGTIERYNQNPLRDAKMNTQAKGQVEGDIDTDLLELCRRICQ